MCLAPSPTPGPVGAQGGEIGGWDLERKLLTAAQRATPRLPAEMREEFAALFSPAAIGITSAVLVAWAVSHFFGVGEIADLILLVVGVVTIGWQAVQAARDIWDFVTIAANARSEADLDRAAEHLAEAVVTIGVTAFVALIMKAGSKLRGRAAVVAENEFWGMRLEQWLARIGKPKAPPLVRQRVETALKYLRERLPGKNAEQIEGYLKGIDFSQDVRVMTLEPGTQLIAYGNPSRLGLFYTKPGTYLDRLGIAPGSRQFMRFEVTQRIRVLESRATGIADTWTDPSLKSLAGGGGLQYILPDAGQFLRQIPNP